MVGGRTTPNLRESLENSHHAWPILGNESTGLLLDLLIMNTPRKDGRDDDADYRQEEIVVLSKSIGVVDVCSC